MAMGLGYLPWYVITFGSLQDGEPKIIVDGNIGLTSIWFAHQFPDAKIYSIDPSERNFEHLVEHVNGHPNIMHIQSALWSKNVYLKIRNETAHDCAFVVDERQANEKGAFQAKSISSLMKEYNWNTIDVLKLDIEGAENGMLQFSNLDLNL
jgi:FkbM family methyltransferase